FPTGSHINWRDYIFSRLEHHVAICRHAELLDESQSNRILAVFDSMAASLTRRPLRLLHGDPGAHNICVGPNPPSVPGFLGCEDALVGDPLFEVGMVSSFQPPRRMPDFLAGYGLPEPNHDQSRLIALYFLRIALSKTVHRLRFGIGDLPGRTPGHHRLYRGLDE